MTIQSITGDNAVTAAAAAAAKTSGSGSDFSDTLQTAVGAYNTDTPLESIFEKASEEYGVPLNLLKAVAKAESNFNTDAVSSCGAQGVMQLMPSTASSLGVTDSFDAGQNIMGGAKMLSYLLEKYDGNTELALAAYNAGSGNVEKYGGIPPFEETQNYVKKVMNYAGEPITIPASATTSSAASSLSGLYSASGTTSKSSLELLQLLAEQMKASALSSAYRSGSSAGNDSSLNTLYSLLGGSTGGTSSADSATSASALGSLLNLYSGTNMTTAAALKAMLASGGTESSESVSTNTDDALLDETLLE